MNRSSEIIDYLSQGEGMESLLIIPSAPPISRGPDGIAVALNMVLSAEDVTDTLMAFRAQAPKTDPESPQSGTFSFGIRKVGRFRVSHARQRGTHVLNVTRIPSVIPAINTLVEDSEAATRLCTFLAGSEGGVLSICGPSAFGNQFLAYSLFRFLNERHRRVLYLMERSLTFLMQHENSIVIQREIGSDVSSLEAGVREGMLFAPHVLYVGNVRSNDAIPSLRCAVETGIIAVLCSNSLQGAPLLEILDLLPAARHALRPIEHLIVGVTPADNKRLLLEIAPCPDTSGQPQ
ncbi:MAG: Flp pilus assembly complex ATPase component TadA [Lentisphaerae bacterium]|nr:Flp pilus assembly complex ATPase component TadA [Lentisphaerota bacterium]